MYRACCCSSTVSGLKQVPVPHRASDNDTKTGVATHRVTLSFGLQWGHKSRQKWYQTPSLTGSLLSSFLGRIHAWWETELRNERTSYSEANSKKRGVTCNQGLWLQNKTSWNLSKMKNDSTDLWLSTTQPFNKKTSKKECGPALPVRPQPPDMCSVLLSVLCHILNKLKVQVGGRSTAARGQWRESQGVSNPPSTRLLALFSQPLVHTHCPHSAAIWPAGKSEPPETRPNT